MFNIKDLMNRMDQWMMAITFAEAGEHKIALEIMNQIPRKKNRKRVSYRVRKTEDNRPVLRA